MDAAEPRMAAKSIIRSETYENANAYHFFHFIVYGALYLRHDIRCLCA